MTSSRLGTGSFRKALPLLGLLFVLLFLMERGLAFLRRGAVPELRASEWIWAPGAAATSVPVAFYAVRDFALTPDDLLGDGAARALRVAITAESEYQLFVNGRFLGGGHWAQGRPLDVYDVSSVVRPGANRILVELRSLEGAGGLLVSLFDETARKPLLVSDASWRIARHDPQGLHEGIATLERTIAAESWGPAPTGRWGRVALARDVERPPPPPADPFAPHQQVVWAASKSSRLLCQSADELRETGADPGNLPPGKKHCEPLVVVDFGTSQCGFVELELRGRPQVPYRVWVGGPEEALPARAPDEVALLVPGTTRWRSHQPHDLARLWIAGASDVVGARLRLHDGAAPETESEPPGGVWGFEPPGPRSAGAGS